MTSLRENTLSIRRYLYSAFGSQAAVDNALMALIETASGMTWEKSLEARLWATAAVAGGAHWVAKKAREASLRAFGIKNKYARMAHDSALFAGANAAISYFAYYPLIGCTREEVASATIATTAAYGLGGWYIGRSMDRAEQIEDNEAEPLRTYTGPGKQMKAWYDELTPRKQLVLNMVVSLAMMAGTYTAQAALEPSPEEQVHIQEQEVGGSARETPYSHPAWEHLEP